MIVVDTSVIIAIEWREPNHQLFTARILPREHRFIPATVVVEATTVLSRTNADPKAAVEHYMSVLGLTVAAIDEAIAAAAQDAFLRFGKGRHPARLNVCDCFSYATAKVLGAPLLFVGNDFAQTDIRAA